MPEGERLAGNAREPVPSPGPVATMPSPDAEKQGRQQHDEPLKPEESVSAFRSLGWLDKYLAVWIFLSMAVGIIIGNFAPNVDDILQRGQFVGVSVPIGKARQHCIACFR